MNRRDFFKRAAVTCAAAIVAPAVVQDEKKKEHPVYLVTCDAAHTFQELLIERRKASMIEIADIYEDGFWRLG